MIVTALRLLVWFTLLTGVAYPVAVTAIGHGLFAHQSMGSVISVGGKPVGSELLAQKFTNAKYFQPRPSTGDTPYATVPSAASNAGPTSESLKKSVDERAVDLQQRFSPAPGIGLPSDLLTTSGSGLDPHISPAAARFQIPAVAARPRPGCGADAEALGPRGLDGRTAPVRLPRRSARQCSSAERRAGCEEVTPGGPFKFPSR